MLRAFVLHRRDYSNTSLLVDLFAAQVGRFPAIARGARRPRNSASALLQPFQPLWVGLSGRGEVRTLTRVESAGRPIVLSGRALPCGFYLNELLVRLLGRQDPHDSLFTFYHAALGGLVEATDLNSTLRQFELRLLEELGFAPGLDREWHTGSAVEPHQIYQVEPGQGPRAEGSQDANGIRVSGATLLALSQGLKLQIEQHLEARALLRGLLEPHLGSKPLKSRELFRLTANH